MSLDELLPDLPPQIALVPFNPVHTLNIRIGDAASIAMRENLNFADLMAAQAASGHAITVLLHGTPAACFGSVSIWKGLEEMWCLLEERARKYPLAMTKIAIAYRDYRVIAGNLRRLQLNVRCSDQRAFRWAKAIGFEPEAKMRRYGPDGSDFYLMSRV
jgi:hypothetical protein